MRPHDYERVGTSICCLLTDLLVRRSCKSIRFIYQEIRLYSSLTIPIFFSITIMWANLICSVHILHFGWYISVFLLKIEIAIPSSGSCHREINCINTAQFRITHHSLCRPRSSCNIFFLNNFPSDSKAVESIFKMFKCQSTVQM